MKIKINIEDVYKLKEKLKKLNKPNIDELELYLDGKKLTISEKTIKNWKFIGLNNYYFIVDKFWKEDCNLDKSKTQGI